METSAEQPESIEINAYLRYCPARNVLGLIANKWTALVMAYLRDGPHRFGELRRRIEGISQKVLTQTLRNLERDGLVRRTVFPTTPPSVEYALTPLGADAARVLAELKDWSEVNFGQVLAARAAYDTRAAQQPQPVR
jgi:DNA-binding HxlR family transcriptional regulator